VLQLHSSQSHKPFWTLLLFSVALEGAMWNSAENAFARSASFREQGEDEEALRWAALERLPTYKRARRGIFKNLTGDLKEVDVRDLQSQDQRLLLERLVDCVDNDPEVIFNRMRSRFNA